MLGSLHQLGVEFLRLRENGVLIDLDLARRVRMTMEQAEHQQAQKISDLRAEFRLAEDEWRRRRK